MPNLPPVVRQEVIPAFTSFLEEVGQTAMAAVEGAPARPGPRARASVTAAVAGFSGYVETPSGYWKSAEVRNVQLFLQRKVGRPAWGTVWFAGEEAYKSGVEWSSGLLFLFAAGYFERFGTLLCSTLSAEFPNWRKAAIVGAARSACEPVRRQTDEEIKRRIRRSGVSEVHGREVLIELRKLRGRMVTKEREIMGLSILERALLKDTFVRLRASQESATPSREQQLLASSCVTTALATCSVAETAPVGIIEQRKIAATALWHLFSSTGPGW